MAQKYMNFPVILLQGYMKNPIVKLRNFLFYCMGSLLARNGDIEVVKREFGIGNMRQEDIELSKHLYYKKPPNVPFTGMKQETFWDYYKNPKTDFEHACLLAYLAMKSIVGKNRYKKTTNIFIWSRMAGNAKAVEDEGCLPVELKKFFTRYQFDKIKLTLEADWHLSYYSAHTRGLYISFRLSKKELVKNAEDKKHTMKMLKEKHNRDIKEALLDRAIKKTLEAYRSNPP